MYADDVKLCLQYKDNSCQFNLQCDLNNFQTWCFTNLLDLNGSKCTGTLDRITLVNDLGVLLSPRLKFADHISSMMNKARSAIGRRN